MGQRALVVLAEGFEEIEAVTVIDLMRRAGIAVTSAGLSGLQVRGSHGLTIVADTILHEAGKQFDALVLPGGQPGTDNLAASETVLSLVRSLNSSGALCAAICAAPLVLARAGVLAGRRATCYPGLEGRLTGATAVNESVVRDGNVVTSRGVGTAIPFALAVVEWLCDSSVAAGLAEKIVYRW